MSRDTKEIIGGIIALLTILGGLAFYLGIIYFGTR